MVSIFNNTSDLINSMIQINLSGIKIIKNKSKKLPISCKYYLTMMDFINDKEIGKFNEYMNDDTRTMQYPFVKDELIDYSMMLEIEQFHNIDLTGNYTINNISRDIDEFIEIVNKSTGKIVLVIDICYLLNFIIEKKTKSLPNHLIDMIIYKLSNLSKITNANISKVSEILILDRENIIENKSNLFYLQLEKCLIKTDLDLNLDSNTKHSKYFIVYKNIDESIINNVYWNVLDPNTKITENIGKIKSPYVLESETETNSYFNIVKIGDLQYFLKKINILDCIEKNLFDLDNNPGIIIDPIDRFYV